MSIPKPPTKRKTKSKTQPPRQRFNRATPKERRAKIEPPPLTPYQQLMGQLLTPDVLVKLARRWNAGDVRERKLTRAGFFGWRSWLLGPAAPSRCTKS